MGCGHSKINIYPRKYRNKSNSKKSVSSEKADSEEEEGVETEADNSEYIEDCDQRKTIKVKPFGGPLLAQSEISTSQQDFFKMLDEKIQNGPDYNSESESEMAAEHARLKDLLKDWETASAGSRSLPSTPKRKAQPIAATNVTAAIAAAESLQKTQIVATAGVDRPATSYPGQIPPAMIHQAYGIGQLNAYRQISYPNHYGGHQQIPQGVYSPQQVPPSGYQTPASVQYRAMYGYQQCCQVQVTPKSYSYGNATPPVSRQHVTYAGQQPPPQHGSDGGQAAASAVTKTYAAPNVNNGSPKHLPNYDQQTVNYSPVHRPYSSPVVGIGLVQSDNDNENTSRGVLQYKTTYANGEVIYQQPPYLSPHSQRPQPSVGMQNQQYRDPREQSFSQHQQMPNSMYRGPPKHYQSSVTIPITVDKDQKDVNTLHRTQFELT
ncbi:unnamed protein product [Acanthoscelides obtectus]|uniref:Uncharacterized protein n=1 Tax=Acanthoscelides obtectus TaxID=200917 RepID=A0A9P0KC32_ACAOB|nr:unnamed protein product [Acanthoscelides obtectus]CAK1672696.1 hypothetical protein AOBTE_LOCUS29050 [Acanthoscelides obtectus]